MVGNNPNATRFESMENNAQDLIYSVCSVIAQPVETALRPWYGTRFYPVPVTFFAAAMMLLAPAVIALYQSLIHIVPFFNAPPSRGMFGLGSFAQAYFIGCAIHAFRLWKLRQHMEREQHSEYEGNALPFFRLLPKGNSFWFIRIVWEPAFVLFFSIVLQDLFIIQSELSLYLRFAALALFMKNVIARQQTWLYFRRLLDTKNAAPLIAKLVQDQATDDDLAPIHLASFPKNIEPDIREAAVKQIARAYSQDK